MYKILWWHECDIREYPHCYFPGASFTELPDACVNALANPQAEYYQIVDINGKAMTTLCFEPARA